MKKRRIHTGHLLIAVLVLLAMLGGAVYYLQQLTVKKPVIAVDAGHDDTYPGYEGYVREADYTLGVAEQLYRMLDQDSRFEPVMVRSAGESLTVRERAAKIEAAHADIVISIHANASSEPGFSGMRIIARPADEDSRILADAAAQRFADAGWSCPVGYEYYLPVREGVNEVMFTEEAGEGQGPAIMEACETPMIIFEGIYVTSPEDTERWAGEEGYAEAADLLYQAVKGVYGK